MRKIRIFDTTLRDGEQSPGCSMDLNEKIEMAKQLERLNVDAIEAGFAIASPGDFKSVKTIAETIKNAQVVSLARALKKDIDSAYAAVKNAQAPLLHLFLATSPVHMQYKLRKEPAEVLVQIEEMVKYAKQYCSDIEFSAEDAMRSEPEFLARVVEIAIKSGATIVNIPDTVGYVEPTEMYERINYLFNTVPNIDKAIISTHCHNDLGMATANSLAAVRAGAGQIECTVNGIGERAGNTALEEVVMALYTRKDYYQGETDINTKQIYRSSRLLSNIIGKPIPDNKSIVGENAYAHESGIHQHGVMAKAETYEIIDPVIVGVPKNDMVLGKHSGRHAFVEKVKSMGFKPTPEEINNAFEKFKVLADKKKYILDGDIEAIMIYDKIELPEMYSYERFILNSGSTIPATATIKLSREGVPYEEAATASGPIEASFKAIDKITRHSCVLEDYSINSVTEGEDAMGEVIVKLRSGDRIINGRGLSIDIIEASIKAYINGVNKYILEHEVPSNQNFAK